MKCERQSKILLLGPYGSALTKFYRNLAPNATIKCFSTEEEELGIAGMMGADGYERIASYNFAESQCDLVSAPLLLQSLDTREATPFFFSTYDALKSGGVFYLSFPDAIAPTVMEKNLYPSWHDEKKLAYMKYYMVSDVLTSLEAVGFEILEIEKDELEDIERVISIICRKK